MDGYVIGKQEPNGIKFLAQYSDWGPFNNAKIFYELTDLESSYRARTDQKGIEIFRIELEPVTISDLEDKISEVGKIIAALSQTQKLIARDLLNDEIYYENGNPIFAKTRSFPD